jgi:hypothetical protein
VEELNIAIVQLDVPPGENDLIIDPRRRAPRKTEKPFITQILALRPLQQEQRTR